MRVRWRSISSFANVGAVMMSPISATASLMFSFKTDMRTVVVSRLEPLRNSTPNCSSSAASSRASYLPAPSSSMRVVNSAKPSLPPASAAYPASNCMAILTKGTVLRLANTSFMPFDRVVTSTLGKDSCVSEVIAGKPVLLSTPSLVAACSAKGI